MARELREQIVPAAAGGDDYVYVDSVGVRTPFKIRVPRIENFEEDLQVFLNPLPPVVQLFYIQAIYLKVLGTHYSVDVSQLSPEEKQAAASDFSEVPGKTAHIKMLQERYLAAAEKCKESPLAKSYILKRSVLDHDPTHTNGIMEARRRAMALYSDEVDKQRQEVMLDARGQIDITVIVENIIAHPANAPVFLKAGSQYRTQLTQNYALMRDMINRSSPALRAQIVDLKLIDEVRWPWRRYSLRSLIEKINLSSPETTILQWIQADQSKPKGFFARRRLVRYAREADKLSMDDKVDFLMANPGDANYFIGNKEFVKSLSQRPDLFFKMLRLPGSTLVYDLFKSPSHERMALARAVNASEDLQLLKEIKTILESLALLSWGYRDLIVRTDLAIESEQDKIRRNKGKEESNDMEVVESEPRVYELPSEDSVAKLDVNDFSTLGELLQAHQKAKQIMIFSKEQGVIVNINLNSEPPDVAFYVEENDVEENSKVKTRDILVVIKRHFPQIKLTSDVSWQVTSGTFQQAFVNQEIPEVGAYQVGEPASTFRPFAFIGQFFNYLFRPRAKDMIVLNSDSEENVEHSDSQSSLKDTSVTSDEESFFMMLPGHGRLENKEERDDQYLRELEERISPSLPKLREKYNIIREKFVDGKAEEAIALLVELCEREIPLALQLRGSPTADDTLPSLILIIKASAPGCFDEGLAAKLMNENDSSKFSKIGRYYLTQLNSAVFALIKNGELLPTPNYPKNIPDNLEGILLGHHPIDQLWILEDIAARLLTLKKGDVNERAIGKLLQDKYIAIVKKNRENPLVKKMVLTSRLLDRYDEEARQLMEKEFADDHVMTLRHMSLAGKLSELPSFTLEQIADYMLLYPQDAKHLVNRFSENVDLLLERMDESTPALRQAIRTSGLFIPTDIGIPLEMALVKQLERIQSSPRLAAVILKDPDFHDELTQHRDWAERMVNVSSADLRYTIRKSGLLKHPNLMFLNSALIKRLENEILDIIKAPYESVSVLQKLKQNRMLLTEFVSYMTPALWNEIHAKCKATYFGDDKSFFEKKLIDAIEYRLLKIQGNPEAELKRLCGDKESAFGKELMQGMSPKNKELFEQLASQRQSSYGKVMRRIDEVVRDIVDYPEQAEKLISQNKAALAEREELIQLLIERRDSVICTAIKTTKLLEDVKNSALRAVLKGDLKSTMKELKK